MSSENEADARLLSLANEKGKFAIQLGYEMDEAMNDAFERGIDKEWFTLVDIAPLAASAGVICRVFKLTALGWRRRHALLPLLMRGAS